MSPREYRQAIVDRVASNKAAGLDAFDGLSSSEIGEYNRAMMFGLEDEAFPDAETWSAWVD